ncbi:MAG: inositol monophosphatase [Burkholderiales bacterium]|jgi:myo-inositol-1(or 4)-monophosphatase|nr:inositol monophosphatase [Burkholderiales bacterium]
MTPAELDARLHFAVTAARRAGDLALSYARDPARMAVESKGVQDLVTAADKAVEAALRSEVATAYPRDAMLGEEEGITPGWDGRAPLWIVDPIDGTANFARRIPVWCVSIGLVLDGEPVLGVIHAPALGETHAAARGRGATLNGAPIRVSTATAPEASRVGLGFSYRRERQLHLAAIDRLLARHCEYSRLGSGALGLAHVADGRFEGYFEPHINAWDVAAGIAIVREAGGFTNAFFEGEGLVRGNPILAGAPGVRGFLESTLADLMLP